jgi:hypothetical protein
MNITTTSTRSQITWFQSMTLETRNQTSLLLRSPQILHHPTLDKGMQVLQQSRPNMFIPQAPQTSGKG